MSSRSTALIFLLVLAVVVPVHAGEFSFTPRVSVAEKFDDNVFFDSGHEIDDSVFCLRPGGRLEGAFERTDASVDADWEMMRYHSRDSLDATNRRVDASFSFRPDELSLVGADAGFRKDYRPDSDLESTGMVFGAKRREHSNIGLHGVYGVDEATRIELRAARHEQEYASPDDTDWSSMEEELALVHELESDEIRLSAAYADYDYERPSSLDSLENLGFSLGLTHPFNEICGVKFALGVRHSKLSGRGPFEESSSDNGFTGGAEFFWKGERQSAAVSTMRDVLPAPGKSGSVERTAFRLDLKDRFTGELEGMIGAGFYVNKASEGKLAGEKIDEHSFRISPRLSYDLTDELSVISAYTYTRLSDHVDKTTTRKNLFEIRIRWEYPYRFM